MEENLSSKQNKLEMNVLRIYPDEDGSECGYCKSKNSSYSFGTVIDSYPVELYEKMMLDGWRRCGNYVYIPNQEKSCCKLYTCRLNVEEFKINKEQIKVMKRFKKYLSGEYEENLEKNKKKEGEKPKIEEKDEICEKIEKILNEYIKQEKYLDIIFKYIQNVDKNYFREKMKELHVRKNTNKKMNFDYSIDFIFVIRKIIESEAEKNKIQFNEYENLQLDLANHFKQFYNSPNEILELFPKTGHINITDTTKVKEKKINIEKKEEKENKIEIKDKNKEPKQKKNKKEKPKEIKEKYSFDYFPEIVNEPEIYLPLKHVYTLELTDKIQMNNERFEVYKKYQKNIHKDPDSKLNEQRYNQSWGYDNLKDNIGIKLPEDLALKTKHPELYPKKYGCYNLIHRIDGKIVAVGIIDILPTTLSSVYLYYDTDYKFLDLGVLTAILEIEYARSFHNLIDNNFKYYTMGFYSENVQKLRYKGFYEPTQLLDRFTMNYVYLKDIQSILKENKLIQLSKEPKNPKYEYLTGDEINKYVDKLQIKFKKYKKVQIVDFTTFVYNCINENYWDKIISGVKKYLAILPKEIIERIEFVAAF